MKRGGEAQARTRAGAQRQLQMAEESAGTGKSRCHGAEFAKEFMKRFTAGDVALGDLLRDLRVEYARDKHNIMGLLYALYSNGDVMIARG